MHVLVTGATGFIGAHVVDCLLAEGIRVRGATRSLSKGREMQAARPEHAGSLDFVEIRDFGQVEDQNGTGIFDEAIKGMDAVIHVASPFTYNTTNNEKELILPAIAGVRSILRAAAATSTVKRIVLTSSFAAVFDADRDRSSYFTYTSADWNPLTYAEAAHPSTSAVVAYRGSKKFAERFAWDFVEERRPGFDLVTLCPPMTFGPVVHPVARAEDLNDSNAMLWSVAKSVSSNGDNSSLPVARVPFWVDVRDLARAHVQALLRPEVGGRRYTVAAPERFSYGLAAKIMAEEFEWARGSDLEEQVVDESYGLDGETAAKELGVTYRSFRETVVELVAQVRGMETA